MTLEDLRVFVAVCESGSVSRAAHALKKSQPGVSQHLTRLEQEFGVPLLERRARGVVPTDAGTTLYESAVQSLAELSAARTRIEALRSGAVGTLSLITGGTTLKHFMRGALLRFRLQHPQVKVGFHQGHSTAECIDALRTHRIDLGFVTMQADAQRIEQRPVLRMRHALLAHAEHPLAGRSRVRPTELANVELISLASRSASFSLLRQGLTARGVVPNSTLTVEDWDLAHELVRVGLGCAIVPAYHAHEFVRQGGVAAVPIEGLDPVDFGWAARRFASLSSPAHAFMRLLEEELTGTQRPGVSVLPAGRAKRTGD